jgi:hypothetical protein
MLYPLHADKLSRLQPDSQTPHHRFRIAPARASHRASNENARICIHLTQAVLSCAALFGLE